MLKKLFHIFLAILSGALFTLAFAPFRIDFIAFISLGVFFYLISKCSKIRSAFFISLLFGIGFFGTSISWIYISIYLFTQSVAAGSAAVIALVILLSFLHTVPFGIFSHILTKNSKKFTKLIIYPALWTLFELIRGELLWGGFPWVSVGYSQTESPLIWYANIGGVYFVTYLVAFIACLIVFYICSKRNYKKTIISIIIILILYIGGYIISRNQPAVVTNKSQQVILIQGDFIQTFKWNPDNLIRIREYYKNIVSKNKNSLIISPENALPSPRQYNEKYIKELSTIASKNNNAVLLGSLSIKGSDIYNSSKMIGKGSGIYNKYHLVPFAEYFPIKFFGYINSIGLSNLSRGNKIQPPMKAYGYSLANFICYEIAYPQQVRNELQNSQVISTISDDSWFGDSIARYQQLQISQVRAIENAKYVIISTSNGMTAIINPKGDITKILPKNIRATLKSKIYLNDYHTIWTYIGMILVYSIILISFILWIILRI